jgi:hypothetical protein
LHIRQVNENEKLLTKDFVVDGSFVFNYSSLLLFLYRYRTLYLNSKLYIFKKYMYYIHIYMLRDSKQVGYSADHIEGRRGFWRSVWKAEF